MSTKPLRQKAISRLISLLGISFPEILHTLQAIIMRVPLSKNMIVINHGSVHMKDATCPDKLCIKQGTISKNGEQIICLPNQVVIAIVSNQYNDVDSSSK